MASAAALILVLSWSSSYADMSPLHAHFVKRGGVVCARKQDVVTIRQAVNSLRYFGQIRALLADGRCRAYAEREKIIDFASSSGPTNRLAAVQIRTEDQPDVVRWILQKDMREGIRFPGHRPY